MVNKRTLFCECFQLTQVKKSVVGGDCKCSWGKDAKNKPLKIKGIFLDEE